MNTATISGNDFLDILFKERNKDYGAYELRRKYDKRVRNAIMGTASIALVIIGGYTVSNHLMASVTVTRPAPPPVDTLRLIDPFEKMPTPQPPVLPSSNPAPAKPTIKAATLVVVRDNNVSPDDEPPRLDDMVNKTIGLANTGGDVDGIDAPVLTGTGTGVVEIPVAKEADDVICNFYSIEIPPTFPGGEEALAKYLGKNIRYPHVAAENGIEGIVVVQFVVDREGNVKDIKVVTPAKGGGLEQEASRVIKAMPKWKPGKQNGRYVSVLYSIPVNFRLSQ